MARGGAAAAAAGGASGASQLGSSQVGLHVSFETPERFSVKYQRNNKRNGLKNLRCFPFCSVQHKEKGFCGCAIRVGIRRDQKAPLEPLYAWARFGRIEDKPAVAVGGAITRSAIMSNERDRHNPTRPWYRAEVHDGFPLTSGEAHDSDTGSPPGRGGTAAASGTRSGGEEDDDEDEDDDDVGEDEDEEEDDDEPGDKSKDALVATKREKELAKRQKDLVYFEINKRKRGWNYSWAANKHTCNAMHALYVYVMVPHGTDQFKVIGIFSSPRFQVFCRRRPPRGISLGAKKVGSPEMAPPVARSPSAARAGGKRKGQLSGLAAPPPQQHTQQQQQHREHQMQHPQHDQHQLYSGAYGMYDSYNNGYEGQQQQQQQQHSPYEPGYSQPVQFLQEQLYGQGQGAGQVTYSYPAMLPPSATARARTRQASFPFQMPHPSEYPPEHQSAAHMPPPLVRLQRPQEQPGRSAYSRNFYTTLPGEDSERTPPPLPQHVPQREQQQAPQLAPEQDDADLFQSHFLSEFWQDEFGIPDLDEQARPGASKRSRERSASGAGLAQGASIYRQLVASGGVVKREEDARSDYSASLPAVDEALPQAPRLLKMRKRDSAQRPDPSPPAEADKVLQPTMDDEEKATNAKLWRLVLVLALVEAHWCEVSNDTRRGSLLVSSFSFDGDPFCFLDESDKAGAATSSSSSEAPGVTTRARRRSSAVPLQQLGLRRRSVGEFLPESMSDDHRKIVQDLATWLIEENAFTRAIHESLGRVPKSAPLKTMKAAFVTVAHEQLGYFCEQHQVSLAQFGSLFEDQPALEFVKQAAARLVSLQDIMRGFSAAATGKEDAMDSDDEWLDENGDRRSIKRERLSSPESFNVDEYNCSGTYEMDEELLDAHAYMREVRGVPWVLRKMIRFIEQRFEIIQHRYDKVVMQGAAKLLSNGTNVYITDGRKRRFTMKSPVPWSKPLAESYKAWFTVMPSALHIVHYYSDSERLERVVTYGRYRIHISLKLQRLSATGEWQTLHERAGYANLIAKGEGFNADTFEAFPLQH